MLVLVLALVLVLVLVVNVDIVNGGVGFRAPTFSFLSLSHHLRLGHQLRCSWFWFVKFFYPFFSFSIRRKSREIQEEEGKNGEKGVKREGEGVKKGFILR